MLFIHCRDCRATARSLTSLLASGANGLADLEVSAFETAHAGCHVSYYVPTGRAESTGPWHEPLVERRLEVRDENGPALAVGTRASLDDPLSWRIEPTAVEERIDVALDHPTFHATLDRALHPYHVPVRVLAAWATQIEEFVRRTSPEDLILLDDDPSLPCTSRACLTLTCRVGLETSLERLGLDEVSVRRIRAAFEDPEFPPLSVSRRLVPTVDRR